MLSSDINLTYISAADNSPLHLMEVYFELADLVSVHPIWVILRL